LPTVYAKSKEGSRNGKAAGPIPVTAAAAKQQTITVWILGTNAHVATGAAKTQQPMNIDQ
jgi:hypothetical protein